MKIQVLPAPLLVAASSHHPNLPVGLSADVFLGGSFAILKKGVEVGFLRGSTSLLPVVLCGIFPSWVR